MKTLRKRTLDAIGGHGEEVGSPSEREETRQASSSGTGKAEGLSSVNGKGSLWSPSVRMKCTDSWGGLKEAVCEHGGESVWDSDD